MSEAVPIEEVLAGEHTGETVTIRGWVHRHRSSGGIVFAVVRDSTGVLQATVKNDEAKDDAFEAADEVGLEASVIVTGTVAEDDRAPGGYELKTRDFRVHGPSEDFPIYEDQSVSYLLDKRHLWLRSREMTDTMKVKHRLLRAFRTFFDERRYTEITPSVVTTNAAEGGATVFTFDYFDDEAYLSQTSQMYLEAAIFALERAYCMAPSFRAEKSRTPRHLTEYWHLEAEEAWADHERNLEIQENLVEHVAHAVAQDCAPALEELGRDPEDLLAIEAPFERITYEEAIDRLQDDGYDIEWGDDFGAPHERALVEGRTNPLFVTHFPAEIKAFYMKLDDDGVTVEGADLLAPGGYGEIIGGSERSEDVERMEEALRREGADLEAYEWFFDLRRYGSVPHSGFGLGVERLLSWFTAGDHVRDATPFPRTPNRAYP
jgi:asparaginyl-tRNA synthetase